jgi:hypothetical protein
VIGTRRHDGVTGLRVLHMTFKNAGDECVRLRYFVQHNEIGHSTFMNCSVHDFRFQAGGKNGEAVYIGTAPEQWGQHGAPSADPDHSNNNWIHHNTFNTQGNECVDIEEGSSGNIVEHNVCTGQRDPKSAGLDARGNGNVFRYNHVFGNIGAGVRLGGNGPMDGADNHVYGNRIVDNRAGGIKVLHERQDSVWEYNGQQRQRRYGRPVPQSYCPYTTMRR